MEIVRSTAAHEQGKAAPGTTAVAILSAFIIIFAASCATGKAAGPSIAPPVPLVHAGSKWVGSTLRKMSIEEKIGQLVSCRFKGEYLNAESAEMKRLEDLVRRGVGGLTLFGGEAYETAQLLNHLQSLARVPLLIASDLERGTGNQITGATLFPPLMSIGATGSEAIARLMGVATAVEGRAMGIHMTFAPVVDVNVNPDNPIINVRSAGEDPELVARLTAAFIRGVQENGMIATAKHFPGHGDTSRDSHSMLPTITADMARLEAVELPPFKRAIEAGVGAVMTAHLFVPALDPAPGTPATLSGPILTGLLRKRLGFKGLIVTDALEMSGITNSFTPEEAALKALSAGADVLLLSPEPLRIIDSLAADVRAGRLPESRVDDAVRRVLEAKASVGLDRRRSVDIGAVNRVVGGARFEESSRLAFEASVTLVKNEKGTLPLQAGEGTKLAVISLSRDKGDYFAGRQFAAAVKLRAPGAVDMYADGDTGKESLDAAFDFASTCDTVVIALFSRLTSGKGSVDLEPGHVELIDRLLALEKRPRVVAVSFGSPYFLAGLPGVDSYVCLYRNTPQTQTIAAEVMFGEIGASGRLPVSLPGLFPAGHGLDLPKKTARN